MQPAENRNLFVRNSTENIEKKLDSLQTLLESQLNSRQATGEEIGTHRETVSEEKEKKDSEAETPEKKEEEQNRNRINLSGCCIIKCWITRWTRNT